jgi:menaquinone-dependent protoporphyrinogen oxidase
MDDSAERQEIPPTESVRKLTTRVGARGHCTFGGRLAPDARGFPASAMARTRAGDWRNQEQIREWAIEVARALSSTGPLRPSQPDEPAHPPM